MGFLATEIAGGACTGNLQRRRAPATLRPTLTPGTASRLRVGNSRPLPHPKIPTAPGAGKLCGPRSQRGLRAGCVPATCGHSRTPRFQRRRAPATLRPTIPPGTASRLRGGNSRPLPHPKIPKAPGAGNFAARSPSGDCELVACRQLAATPAPQDSNGAGRRQLCGPLSHRGLRAGCVPTTRGRSRTANSNGTGPGSLTARSHTGAASRLRAGNSRPLPRPKIPTAPGAGKLCGPLSQRGLRAACVPATCGHSRTPRFQRRRAPATLWPPLPPGTAGSARTPATVRAALVPGHCGTLTLGMRAGPWREEIARDACTCNSIAVNWCFRESALKW